MGFDGVAPAPESVGVEEIRDLLVQYRAYSTAPSIDESRLEVLRDGLWEAMTDDEVQNSLNEKGRPVDPIKGADLVPKLEQMADSIIQIAEDVNYNPSN